MPVITSPEWSGSEHGGRRYSPFTINVERLKPWHTLTGRQHFFLDHDWMTELGGEPAGVPAAAGHARAVRRAARSASTGELGITVRYLTPHNKWSIHSEYQDNLFMLSLSRGGQTIWMSTQDAAKIGVERQRLDRGGQPQRRRGRPRDRLPPDARGHGLHVPRAGRLIDVPLAETYGKRGGIHNSLTRLFLKPTPPDRRLRAAVVRLQLPRPHRQPA